MTQPVPPHGSVQPAFSVCVFCGSRPGASPIHLEHARATGQWIGSHGGQLVYGGGRTGLMGAVADATLRAGGSVIGIIPQALVTMEVAHEGCTELHVVQTMHERKRMMAERADVFLALAGGIGTFEELFEVWTWRQLGYHDKPIGMLNTAGYYDGLLAFLRSSVEQQFMSDWQMGLLQARSDPATLLPALVQAAGLSAVSRLQAI
jgi:uncharacterized protein (TIGR00730 family)